MASTVSTVKKSSLLSQKEGEGKDFALQRKEINRLLGKECKDNIANDVYGENDEQSEAKARREQFVQHWSTRTRGFSDWGRLDALLSYLEPVLVPCLMRIDFVSCVGLM